MTACASSPPTSKPQTLAASLRQRCPQLPLPTDGGRAAMLQWSREVAHLYDACAAQLDAVIDSWPD
jgi:hypothetical protein